MEKIHALSIILLLSFPYPAALSGPVPKVSREKLTEICSRAVDLTFCVESHESDPRTAASNLHGLANVSVSLAVSNSTAALGLVESLAGWGADPLLKGRYAPCSSLYEEGVLELEKAGRNDGSEDFGGMGESAPMALDKLEDCSD